MVVLQLRGRVGAQEQVLGFKNGFLQPPLLLHSHRRRTELEGAGCRPGGWWRRGSGPEGTVWSGPRAAGQGSGRCVLRGAGSRAATGRGWLRATWGDTTRAVVVKQIARPMTGPREEGPAGLWGQSSPGSPSR